MPTRERLAARAAATETIDLIEAADRTGYAAETLRKMMWTLPPEQRPPLVKRRNRWRTTIAEIDAWAIANDRLL